MSMDRKNLLSILSIALAVIVPLMLALQSQNTLSSSPVVKIKMTGYDPRDLLHGHYLMFRYEWNWDKAAGNENNPDACYGKDCCLCVAAQEIDPEVRLMSCGVAKKEASCAHIIRGQTWGGNDFAGPPTQYFVDEEKALPLEQFFRRELGKTDFHMGLSLPPSGKAQIEQLYIDGRPYLEYMEEHPEKFVLDGQGETPADQSVEETPEQPGEEAPQ